jgi:hypothetical protein
MATADLEARWVDARNDLYANVSDRPDGACQLPDWSLLDIEACKACLQESVVDGYHVSVEAGRAGPSSRGHRASLAVGRTRDLAPQPPGSFKL